MARVGLDANQKSHSIFDTENFKMKTGQKARVLLIEQEFDVEWVHWVDEFGYAICQGAYDTMMKEGTDAHCKFCQVAEQGGVKKARRKFVTLLVVYRTNSKGQVLTPITVDVNPWIFGDDKFNDLLSKKEQWGDLRKHDLGIECLGEQYQKMRIDVLPDAVWMQDDTTKEAVATAFKEAKAMYAKDMRMLLGRDVTDPDKLAEILNEATGAGVVPDYAAAGTINQMFSDAPAIAASPATDVDFGALLEDTDTPTTVEDATVVTEAPVAEPEAVVTDPLATTPVVETPAANVNFDDLLSD